MNRTYFASAVTDVPGDILAAEFEAESFAAALREALDRAEARFGDRVYRLTSLVEQPNFTKRGPISIAFGVCQGRGA